MSSSREALAVCAVSPLQGSRGSSLSSTGDKRSRLQGVIEAVRNRENEREREERQKKGR